MQHSRIYRAWLPSEIFPRNSNAVEREKTIIIANRLRRTTKRGFSRASWVFDVVLISGYMLYVVIYLNPLLGYEKCVSELVHLQSTYI